MEMSVTLTRDTAVTAMLLAYLTGAKDAAEIGKRVEALAADPDRAKAWYEAAQKLGQLFWNIGCGNV